MIWIYRLLIVLVSGTVFNVWLLRFSQVTPYRGGDATTLVAEFEAYGLNETLFYMIGGLKLLAAAILLVGIKIKKWVLPAAQFIALLMIGAIAMHLKIADPIIKSFPAIVMLTMCLAITRLHKQV